MTRNYTHISAKERELLSVLHAKQIIIRRKVQFIAPYFSVITSM